LFVRGEGKHERVAGDGGLGEAEQFFDRITSLKVHRAEEAHQDSLCVGTALRTVALRNTATDDRAAPLLLSVVVVWAEQRCVIQEGEQLVAVTTQPLVEAAHLWVAAGLGQQHIEALFEAVAAPLDGRLVERGQLLEQAHGILEDALESLAKATPEHVVRALDVDGLERREEVKHTALLGPGFDGVMASVTTGSTNFLQRGQ